MALLCFHNAYLTADTVVLPKLEEDFSPWLFILILFYRARVASHVFLAATVAMIAGAIFGIKAAGVE